MEGNADEKHLGIPKYSMPSTARTELTADTFLSTSLVWLGSKLLSRSGEQLYVTDRYSDEDPRPLLEIMADPSMSYISTANGRGSG
jgi:hypothetical protein